MTPLETVLIGFSSGIFGWIVKHTISNKTYVKKEVCGVVHKGVEKTLKRIEEKLDTLNGGSN